MFHARILNENLWHSSSGIPRSASSSHNVSHWSLLTEPDNVFNILRCSACCWPFRTWITLNRFSTIFEGFVPHFYLCCTHYTIPESLLNHPNSFCGGMFKLNAKFDTDSSLYSLSHFECNSHTVHTHTQQCLPCPLTSTVKLSFLGCQITSVLCKPFSLY